MIYDFECFRFDIDRFELRAGDETLAIEPKAFLLLGYLIENRDRVVPKEELFEAVWPGVIVSDASLTTAIRQIRKILGDDGAAQTVIRTVRGQGLRFVATVTESPASSGLAARASIQVEGHRTEELLAATHQGRPVIAVIPFSLLATDESHQAISEAIPGELIATLSRLRWLKVIARGSSFQFATGPANLEDVRTKLNADYLLTGSVELKGQCVSIIVELMDTRSLELLWSENYGRPLDDIYELREQIARDVANLLELRLPLFEADRLRHIPSENLDAWGHFHLGLRHMSRYDRADNAVAGNHFRSAIALDPQFARAHAALSYTEFQSYFQMFGEDLNLNRSQAMGYAEQAMALDPLDPSCNLMLARAKWLFGDVEHGLTLVDRSLQLNPNYAFGFYNSAILRTVLCDGLSADEHVGNALDLSPLDPHLQSMLGTRALAAFIRNDLDKAHDYAEQALRSPNPHLYVFTIAALVHSKLGNVDRVEACINSIRRKKVPFGRTEFLSHYDLRNPTLKAELESCLDRIGV